MNNTEISTFYTFNVEYQIKLALVMSLKLLIFHQNSFDWTEHILSKFVMVNTLRDICGSTFMVLTPCYIRLTLTFYDPVLEIFELESFATHCIPFFFPFDTHDNLATLVMCLQVLTKPMTHIRIVFFNHFLSSSHVPLGFPYSNKFSWLNQCESSNHDPIR